MANLISVVVPVYNAADYLVRCVNSIREQSFSNLEIILVDDGSTDSSGLLCDQLKKLDDRIVVIHNKNEGLSAARNAGLVASHGEYVVFVDSDDWLEEETIENALIIQHSTNADLVVWGYYADYTDDRDSVLYVNEYAVCGMCQINDYKILLQDKALGLIGYAWNKLYKRSIINKSNARFQEGVSLVEDILFNALICQECNSIVFSSFIGTHYMQRPRITLGNQEYLNYFELKMRACKARESILMHFGCQETELCQIMSSYYISIIRGFIRKVMYSDIPAREQYVRNKVFLNSPNVRSILLKVYPHGVRNSITFYLARWKMTRILQWLIKYKHGK